MPPLVRQLEQDVGVALLVGGAPAHEIPAGELVADLLFPTALEDVGAEQLDGKGAGDRDPDAIPGELDHLADAEGVGPLGGTGDVDSAFWHPPAGLEKAREG